MSKNFQRDNINPAPLDIDTLTLAWIFDGVVPEMLIDDDADKHLVHHREMKYGSR